MKKYTSKEIEKILREYERISNNLNYSDYHQCASNLIEFMEFIDENELIKEFIKEHNKCKYDIKKILTEREIFHPFITGRNKVEKISMAYQMLQYAIQKFNGDYSLLYGRFYYVGGSKLPDVQFNKFNEHIVNPLIKYINLYLENFHADILEQEQNDRESAEQRITIKNANNFNLVMNSKVDGDVITDVKINDNDYVKIEVEKLLESIKNEMISINLNMKEEVCELISKVDQSVEANQEPKLSWLGKIKNLCEESTIIVSCIDKIIDLISKLGW